MPDRFSIKYINGSVCSHVIDATHGSPGIKIFTFTITPQPKTCQICWNVGRRDRHPYAKSPYFVPLILTASPLIVAIAHDVQ